LIQRVNYWYYIVIIKKKISECDEYEYEYEYNDDIRKKKIKMIKEEEMKEKNKLLLFCILTCNKYIDECLIGSYNNNSNIKY
jgi:hypothetical protein